jgi:hypothetical protein
VYLRARLGVNYALAELAELLNFLGLGGAVMAVDYAFLRVPEAVVFGERDYLVDFVHVEVAAGAVVSFKQRNDGLVPAL